MYELSYTHFNTVFNETILSTDNSVYIHLTAGSRQVGGIYFLLSWTNVDPQYFRKPFFGFDVKCKYLKYIFNNEPLLIILFLCIYLKKIELKFTSYIFR